MSDYDNKDIPTLDDIIDDGIIDNDRTDIADLDDSDTSVQPEHDHPESEHSINEQQRDAQAGIDNDSAGNTDENQNLDRHRSHQLSAQTHTALQITYQEIYNKLTSPALEEQRIEAEQNTIPLEPVSSEPILLDPIVDAVATQIMPELEQQLKHLIKQALEDNLPEAVSNTSTDIDKT